MPEPLTRLVTRCKLQQRGNHPRLQETGSLHATWITRRHPSQSSTRPHKNQAARTRRHSDSSVTCGTGAVPKKFTLGADPEARDDDEQLLPCSAQTVECQIRVWSLRSTKKKKKASEKPRPRGCVGKFPRIQACLCVSRCPQDVSARCQLSSGTRRDEAEKPRLRHGGMAEIKGWPAPGCPQSHFPILSAMPRHQAEQGDGSALKISSPSTGRFRALGFKTARGQRSSSSLAFAEAAPPAHRRAQPCPGGLRSPTSRAGRPRHGPAQPCRARPPAPRDAPAEATPRPSRPHRPEACRGRPGGRPPALPGA